jgi:hypothetical protein
MAAFTLDDSDDRTASDAHMAKVRSSPGITQRTVTCDGQLVGRIARCGSAGVRELAAGNPARATTSMPHQCRASSINAAIDVVDTPHRATRDTAD